MSFARFEILLPQTFNDGRQIPQSAFEQTWFELIERFGALTVEPAPRRGIWTHELERFEDELVRVVLDLGDTAETDDYIRGYKERLKQRFDQIDIWIVAFPIRII